MVYFLFLSKMLKYKEIFCVDKHKGNPFIFICVDTQTDRQTKISSRVYRKQASQHNLKVAASWQIFQIVPTTLYYFIRSKLFIPRREM